MEAAAASKDLQNVHSVVAAQALKIEAEALKSNPQIAELRWIEKWNGVVPTYWGSASPFIGIGK